MDIRARFLEQTRREGDCQLWLGSTASGYGTVAYKPGDELGSRTAHRRSHELFKGPIPPGAQVNHHCGRSICVNPEHVYAGTHQDNMRDALRHRTERTEPLVGLGSTGLMEEDRLTIEVRVLAERSVYGRREVKVTPVAGSGERWVLASKVVAK